MGRDGDALRATDLRYAYPGAEEPALRGIDVGVGTGEIFGFLGPSGAGKSTVVKVLTGLLDGYEGTVEAPGRPLAEWGEDYYERVGVAPETPNHYPKLTGRGYLLYRGVTVGVLGAGSLSRR